MRAGLLFIYYFLLLFGFESVIDFASVTVNMNEQNFTVYCIEGGGGGPYCESELTFPDMTGNIPSMPMLIIWIDIIPRLSVSGKRRTVLDIENEVLDNKRFNKHEGTEVNQYIVVTDRRNNKSYLFVTSNNFSDAGTKIKQIKTKAAARYRQSDSAPWCPRGEKQWNSNFPSNFPN